MKNSIKLNVLTPEKKIFSGEVIDVNTENELGRLEILPNHVDMITVLNPTVTSFTTADGKKQKLFTSTGVLKVEDNEINLLCEAAELPEDIDVSRAEEARKKAEQLLKDKGDIDYKRAELKLKRAMARIRAKS
jgi:F-type H+-transporting ATPase subunit epsilon